MNQQLSRRQFLKADVSGRRSAIRPPWALAELQFINSCTRCDKCISACPEHIIVKGDAGYPQIDFKRGECSFCHECIDVCKDSAFMNDNQLSPWNLQAKIESRCLAFQGVHCMVCKEQCEASAIRFMLLRGGVAVPKLDAQLCTGCGACYRPCPVGAISFTYQATDSDQQLEQLEEA